MNAKNRHFRMPPHESEEKNDETPVTPDEFLLVRSGGGTLEQKTRVESALNDPESPLYKWLEESGQWVQQHGWGQINDDKLKFPLATSEAGRNFYRVLDYIRHKRETGIFTHEQAKVILVAGGRNEDPDPTPTQYAMEVTRMIKAICKLHPELASEARSIPLTPRKR